MRGISGIDVLSVTQPTMLKQSLVLKKWHLRGGRNIRASLSSGVQWRRRKDEISG